MRKQNFHTASGERPGSAALRARQASTVTKSYVYVAPQEPQLRKVI